ncbi:ADP-ribosylglycohydrolase family protein [Arthrobacter castelli]|uniref:ADP-ribosylglycohydrolase family protein n=1 Tax=Arthrobacter castelli TaxID=271431 RepID=UPI00041B6D81|nr:ADP-ribosylglycohydrolase family protein [Arthrobacter castelli]
MPRAPSLPSRIHGCLLGGALGDALGSPVETMNAEYARNYFGPAGPAAFSPASEIRFTDETQLSLYSVDGLLEAVRWANDGVPADETACVWLAYLRWLRLQGVPVPDGAPAPPAQWLDQHPVMQRRGEPDQACLTGLASGDMGTRARPVNPQARGAGAVVRSAPFGLLPYVGAETVSKLSRDTAALTHGHPSAIHGAEAFSLIVHHLMHDGGSLAGAAATVLARLRAEHDAKQEVVRMLAAVVELAGGPPVAPEDLAPQFEGGTSAVDVLGIGLYAALSAEAADAETVGGHATDAEEAGTRFRYGVGTAIHHDGKCDAAGSIAGNLLGTRYGDHVLPAEWLEALQGREVIHTLADSLIDATFGP